MPKWHYETFAEISREPAKHIVHCRICGYVYHTKRGSTWYIVCEVHLVRERDRQSDKDGSDVTRVALKLAMSLHFPLPKICPSVSTLSNGAEFTLFVAKNTRTIRKIRTLRSASLRWRDKWLKNWTTRSRNVRLHRPSSHRKMNQTNAKNYWKLTTHGRPCFAWTSFRPIHSLKGIHGE